LSRARIAEKAVVVQQRSHIAELEEANVQLCAELAAANAKVAEVEQHERSLKSDYSSLCSDFIDLQTVHAALGKEKEDAEKVEREKAQRFYNPLCKKLVGLRNDVEKSVAMLGGQCFEFPATNATVGTMLDWFWMEVQALPTAFAESIQNITCYAVAGILKMLARVKCGHLSELRKLAMSCDASILHDIPEDLGKIARNLVRNWWTNHGLLYCLRRVEEDNRVSFIPKPFIV
jgi:hypothetical protein